MTSSDESALQEIIVYDDDQDDSPDYDIHGYFEFTKNEGDMYYDIRKVEDVANEENMMCTDAMRPLSNKNENGLDGAGETTKVWIPIGTNTRTGRVIYSKVPIQRDSSIQTYDCRYCGIIFYLKTHLNHHLQTHSAEEKQQCKKAEKHTVLVIEKQDDDDDDDLVCNKTRLRL